MGWMSDDAWDEVDRLKIKLARVSNERDDYRRTLNIIAEPYWELSHDKIRSQRDHYKNIAKKVLEEYWVDETPESIDKEIDDDF